jgi:hypothetical protein
MKRTPFSSPAYSSRAFGRRRVSVVRVATSPYFQIRRRNVYRAKTALTLFNAEKNFENGDNGTNDD